MNKTMTIEHPNGRGTGSAMRITFHDLGGHGRNYVSVEIAPQSSIGKEPTFDWVQSFCVGINRHDVAAICRTIAGEREEVVGIRCKNRPENHNILSFCLTHDTSLAPGYWMTIDHYDNTQESTRAIFLDNEEVHGLRCAFEHALCPLIFEF